MKLTKIYSLTLITVLGLSGCSKVEDYQDDPNRVVRVSPDFLLPDIEVNAFKNIDAGAALASRQLAYINGVNAQQYYNWQRGSFGNYDNIKQVEKMVQEADRTGNPVYKSPRSFFQILLLSHFPKPWRYPI